MVSPESLARSHDLAQAKPPQRRVVNFAPSRTWTFGNGADKTDPSLASFRSTFTSTTRLPS